MVNFIIRQDKKNIFQFATLQSHSGKKLLEEYNINWKQSDSFVIIENARPDDSVGQAVRRGKVFQKSSAALRLYNKLPWYWKWTQVFWIVPKFIRDGVYNLIAQNRYRWFGKKEQCMIPTAQVKQKFLD